MEAEILKEHLRRKPFVPFRITLTNGAAFEVRKAEAARITPRSIEIASPLEGETQSFITIALIHIMFVEITLTTSLS
jgi:hypothetical protein